MTTDDLERQRVITEIRAHMATLGADVSALTDEQLEAGVERVGDALRACGYSAHDAATRLARVLAAWPVEPCPHP